VFAVLAVLVALVWGAVAGWLREYERYAQATVARARLVAGARAPLVPRTPRDVSIAPRRLFGLAFESRPPPLTA